MVMVLQTALIVFAIALCAMCVAGVFSPNALIRLVKRVWESGAGIYSAVGVRLLFGALLIFLAPASKFPLILMLLGGISMLGAVVIPFVGRDRFGRLITMFENISAWLVRLWLLFGIAFGGFVIYAVW